MSWTLIGDVSGRSTYHVGDEAMMKAVVALFAAMAPDDALTIVSGDPDFSAAEYGVDAVPRLGFEDLRSTAELEGRLAELSDAPASAVPAFARLSQPGAGLVLAGGGNLNSAWPWATYERAALCRRAARHGAPIIILGQTVGPELTPRLRELLGEMLAAACWIGVREAPSYALCLELGAPPERLSYQLDDAAFLSTPCAGPEADPWIAVTFHPFVDPGGDDPRLDQLAAQLEQLGAASGRRLLFVPHAAAAPDAGTPWSDTEMGLALQRRMSPGCMHIAPLGGVDETVRLTQAADMVVSSRYHPLVFGLSAGVPGVGVWCDAYTRVKLQGALHHYDRTHDDLGLAEAAAGGLAETAQRVWSERGIIRQSLLATRLRNLAADDVRRGELATVVRTRRRARLNASESLVSALAQALRSSETATAAVAASARAEVAALEHSRREAETYALSLRAHLDQESAALQQATTHVRALQGALEGLRSLGFRAADPEQSGPSLVGSEKRRC